MRTEQELWSYVEGELTPAEASEIEEAAASDPILRERLDTIRAIKEELLAGAPEPPEEFPLHVADLARRLPKAPVVHLDEARRFLKKALVAAAILAALGLAFLAAEVLPRVLGPDPIRAESLLGR